MQRMKCIRCFCNASDDKITVKYAAFMILILIFYELVFDLTVPLIRRKYFALGDIILKVPCLFRQIEEKKFKRHTISPYMDTIFIVSNS